MLVQHTVREEHRRMRISKFRGSMEFAEDDEMPRVDEAEPVSVWPSTDTSTSLLLEKARKLLQGSKRKSSSFASCSVNSPFCEGPRMKRMFLVKHNEEVMKQSVDAERVEQYSTGLASSSVGETNTLLLEMTLAENKKLGEMHSLGLDEKVIKGFGNDKTGNNSTTSSLPPACSANCPFPVANDYNMKRNERLDIPETLKLRMEVLKQLHQELEVQRQSQLQLRLNKSRQYFQKPIENKYTSGLVEKMLKCFDNNQRISSSIPCASNCPPPIENEDVSYPGQDGEEDDEERSEDAEDQNELVFID